MLSVEGGFRTPELGDDYFLEVKEEDLQVLILKVEKPEVSLDTKILEHNLVRQLRLKRIYFWLIFKSRHSTRPKVKIQRFKDMRVNR